MGTHSIERCFAANPPCFNTAIRGAFITEAPQGYDPVANITDETSCQELCSRTQACTSFQFPNTSVSQLLGLS